MIDYKAAALMIHQLRNWGSPPKRLPDDEAARMIVVAALGDAVLYVECPLFECFKIGHNTLKCPGYRKVWPDDE